MLPFILLAISFTASIIGAICGIGGGVIIKPVLDLTCRSLGASTINFLSCCTVLSMSCYNVSRSMLAGEKRVNLRTGTPLAIGAAGGGVAGKLLFNLIRDSAGSPTAVSIVQNVCLGLITVGTLLYTVFKARIPARQVRSTAACLLIGLVLGIMSSFLGIGGGPINLVVLFYFFGMDTKTAAANSLYIILFSQLASLLMTIVQGVPPFTLPALLLMCAGGIGGGIVGRLLNRRMDNGAVDKLFIGLMAVIVCICIFNVLKYAGVVAL